jgi:hypothetical protein
MPTGLGTSCVTGTSKSRRAVRKSREMPKTWLEAGDSAMNSPVSKSHVIQRVLLPIPMENRRSSPGVRLKPLS